MKPKTNKTAAAGEKRERARAGLIASCAALCAFLLALTLSSCASNAKAKKPVKTPEASSAEETHVAAPSSHASPSVGAWKVVREPTCTEEGLKERELADGTTETEIIAATGHTPVIDEAREPTCLAVGKTEGSHCAVCGEVLTAQTSLSAYGHNFGPYTQTKAPTCTGRGCEQHVCTRCGEKEIRWISAVGHKKVTDPAVPSRCTALGKSEGCHCEVCGRTIKKQQTTPALGHDFVSGKCSRCGLTTGNITAVPFDAVVAYIRVTGKQSNGVITCDRGPYKVNGEECKYLWTYSPSDNTIILSLARKGGNQASFSVSVKRKDSFLTWTYRKPKADGSVMSFSGVTDFDDFETDVAELPYCRYSDCTQEEIADSQKDAVLLEKALLSRVRSEAAKLGISLGDL